jgi:hypothetical protein
MGVRLELPSHTMILMNWMVWRYKAMTDSNEKPFTLHHCWKLLEHVDKWKLREKEAPL